MQVNILDQTIYYTIEGEGLPIVILHGLFHDSLTMESALEETSIQLKGFKRIYIDMPGMGQSPKHNLSNNSNTMLDLIVQLIRSIISTHPFIIMGYSYGGYIARGIAKKLSKQVIGEILICPVVIPDQTQRTIAPITNREIDGTFLSSLNESKANSLLNNMVIINNRTYHRIEADFFRARALGNTQFLQELFKYGYASSFIDEDTSIHNHKTLVFLGYQDNVVGYTDMIQKLEYYPKATVNLLTNASHSFFLEQPTQFEYILNSWLRQYMR